MMQGSGWCAELREVDLGHNELASLPYDSIKVLYISNSCINARVHMDATFALYPGALLCVCVCVCVCVWVCVFFVCVCVCVCVGVCVFFVCV